MSGLPHVAVVESLRLKHLFLKYFKMTQALKKSHGNFRDDTFPKMIVAAKKKKLFWATNYPYD